MRGDRRWILAPLGAAAGQVAIFVAALSIPLASAASLQLSSAETTGWVFGLYGTTGLLTVVLSLRFREPLVITGNIFLLIFVASLGAELPWPELMGAVMLAGVLVAVIGPLGILDPLTRLLPSPVVQGLLAGVVLHFFVDLFSATGAEPLVVGTTVLVYLVSRRYLEPPVPALLPAFAVGTLLAVTRGQTGSLPSEIELIPTFTTPELSWNGVLTVTPLAVVLIAVQANVPALVFLHGEGFRPDPRLINGLSGLGTVFVSLLGPTGVSLSLPAAAMCGGADAGPRNRRYLAAVVAGIGATAIGVGAGGATAVAEALPASLLAAFVGLAVIGILTNAVRQLTAGPGTLGPLFAFGVAQSDLELLGLGPFFWALAGGIAVWWLIEPGPGSAT